MRSLLDWPFQVTSTLAVQGWGFWLALMGMVVSMCGFGITLAQLARARRATTAVANEVRRIQFAVSKYDASIEASRAETLLDTARKSVKSSDWAQAGETIEAFSKALHTLRELKVPEIGPHECDLDGAMMHANRLCERLDKVGEAGLPDGETVKTLSSMREHDRLLTSIRIALERSNISE